MRIGLDLAAAKPSLAIALALLATGTVRADIYGGVSYPMEDVSFADVVVDYNPVLETDPTFGIEVPAALWRNPADALGPPNYTPPPPAQPHNTDQFVSLGNGGILILQFTDNVLTGSGDTTPDLWIFEAASNDEILQVEVSNDGSTWHPLGTSAEGVRGIDIDAFGLGPSDRLYYVRLTDVAQQYPAAGAYGSWAGADIDAVGAVPEASPLVLLAVGTVIVPLSRRRS